MNQNTDCDFKFFPVLNKDVEIALTASTSTLYTAEFAQGKYLSMYFEEEQEHFLKISQRIKLRISCIKNQIKGVKLTTYNQENQVGEITLSSFTLGQICDFLELLKTLNIAELSNRKIALNHNSADKKTESIYHLIKTTLEDNESAELLKKLLNDGLLTDKDLINTGYRKQQLSIFKKLLAEPNFLFQYQSTNELSNHSEEKTWQYFFEQNEWIFGYGLDYRFNKILQRESHINTANLDGSNSVIIDYVLADNKFTTFVEIKKPSTKLFKNDKNRANCWRLSNELYEAHSQILEQKYSAQKKFENHDAGYCHQGNKIHQNAYDSKSILLIGSWSELDLDNDQQRHIKERTLELFRRDLRNIEIITFDELYERAKFIVEHNKEASISY